MNTLTWQDIDGIAHALAERYPEKDPLSVPAQDLRRLIAALPGFADAEERGDVTTLEAISAAWYEEYES